jgi:Protein of unknown function (DUF3078)
LTPDTPITMKKILLVAVGIFMAFAATAQIVKIDSLSPWKKSFKAGLNLNQASFSSNWKAGGVNSFGFNTFLNFKANYKKDKVSWDNEFDLLYGMVNNSGQGYRKTLDRIYLDSKYGRQLSEKWNMFVAVNFQTQFAKGYKYVKGVVDKDSAVLISNLFAPAFVTASLGFQYQPSPAFKMRISPVAPRVTIVSNSEEYIAVDPIAPYGVPIGETTRYEWLAAQILAEYNKDIMQNINLKWRYLLFANYENFNLQEIDHRLDLNITAKVNRFINVSVGGILLYDYDQDPGAQVSQAFSLGVMYTFQNYKP